MREGQATVIHRQDYAPPAFWIRSVELVFDLDPQKTIVASKLHVERNADAPPQPLQLHGDDITVLRVMCGGESLSFRVDGGSGGGLLIIDNPPAADSFVLEIRNTCCPAKNTQLSGLYTSGSGLFTQCEAEGFRRITYFLDRPDVMAVYTVTLRADKEKYPVLLSNGNLVEQGDLGNGRHFATWHDPFPKPSYLFALVAANLACREQRITTRAGKEHLLQVWVRRADLGKTEHAMDSLIASIVWDEARFGLPLDLDRFMIVAVDDFNMGAMENKGLNIFNTKYVLASPATATDDDFMAVEAVVGHEYFHNWTGNRITCRDWFQLSLKEGLTVFRDQEFSMDMAGGASARAVQRIQSVRKLRALQFPEDAGSMAHPVRPDSYAEINNFYTATVYDKGSEVVRMMQTLVGRDGFERGITLYFERHDGQAVTCDDFAQAIADANPGSALATRLDAFKRWYSQPGTPRLRARGSHDAAAQTYTLTLSQQPPQGQAPAVIPVRAGLLSAQGGALGDERLLVLDGAEQTFTFDGVTEPPVPSLLRGFSAPVVLDDGLTDAELLVLLAHDSDPFNRWEAGQRLGLSRLLAALPQQGGAGVVAGLQQHPHPSPLPQAGEGARHDAVQLDAAYVDAMRGVLRHPTLDAAFKDLVLQLPGEGYVAEQLSSFDPQRIHVVRRQMQFGLAAALHDDWAWAFDAHTVHEAYAPTPAQAGRRALANTALFMLCLQAQADGTAVWPGRAYQRVKEAGNMTDRIGALAALVHSHAELADAALQRFHAAAAGDALVIDKWFALQAMAPEPLAHEAHAGSAIERAQALLKHPDFSLRNPNRARSLVLALCRDNPAAFHRADGAGYAFWADRLLQLDATNPQLAARLARAMDRWAALEEPFRSAAHAAIQRVAARPDLSADVREIVNRALENQA